MIRAMAKEAEATRERTAAMIRADGELQAAMRLTEAAKLLRINPTAIELRQLQTLERISKESNQSTVVIPSDTLKSANSLISAGIVGQLNDSGNKTVSFGDNNDDGSSAAFSQ